MKVGLITSGNQECGIAEYGKNLMKHLPQVDWSVYLHNNLWSESLKEDIVVLNYEPGLFPEAAIFKAKQSEVKHRVLILHTSHDGYWSSNFSARFEKIVVHEASRDIREGHPKFVHIPMGIPEPLNPNEQEMCQAVKDYRGREIGSVGFPFPWKGFPEVAEAAKILGSSCFLLMPEGPGIDAAPIVAVCKSKNPEVHCCTDWCNERATLMVLGSCKVLVFAYHGGNYGISGAIRLGLATGLPIVAVRNRQFRDLYEYEDEIEFVDSPTPTLIADGIRRVLESGKKPKRVLEDMSWANSAAKYYKLFEELLDGRT